MDTPGLLEGYVTRSQLAAELNVCNRTVSRYENQPSGLPSLTIGGRKMYRLETVRRWLERRERQPNPSRRDRGGAPHAHP